MERPSFDSFQHMIKYKFNDELLLRRALTHSSAESENNQRLEFLGDAVLELVISEFLYNLKRRYEEGTLTKIRAAIVTKSALAKAAKKIDLGSHIIFGKGEAVSKGGEKPSILSDAFEALIGAIYIDGGYNCAKTTVLCFLEEIISEALTGKGYINYKSTLQEHLNKKGVYDIRYIISEEEGPDHDKVFHIKLYEGKKEISAGKGRSKKQAEQDAAKNAVEILNIKI